MKRWEKKAWVCALLCPEVVAPTAITLGSDAGEPMVLTGEESPLDTVTAVPAATAASSNIRVTSWLVSGNGLLPKDSFRTST